MTAFADRIRGIVGKPAPRRDLLDPSDFRDPRHLPDPRDQRDLPAPPDRPDLSDSRDLSVVLGGHWYDGAFVVDRRWEPAARHGTERIGELADRMERSAAAAALFTGGAPARPPFVFFDLETTGLNGGAGTLAFLVGCGWFDDGGAFVTRQFLLVRHADERRLLEGVAAALQRAGVLVSFNGKSFDAPLLEGRYLFHRLAWNGREMPHVDLLHPARRFWKRGSDFTRPDESSCSLQTLEKRLVGLRRRGDVPGFEIPSRYFSFVRSGDAAPLERILEHNRLDLLTLAALTARLLHLARSGPETISDPREALALGHVYARAHRQAQGDQSASKDGDFDERARASFQRAIDRSRSPRGAYDPIRIDALRALALACRRARQHEQAARLWAELVETRGCPPSAVREATEALAIHHEHRLRDLVSAKRFALGSLATLPGGLTPSFAEATRHRLARIERKMDGLAQNGQLLD